MTLKTTKSFIYASVALAPFVGKTAFAQVNTINNAVNAITPGDTNTDLSLLVQNIINILLAVIGVVAVIMLIVGGFRYVFSQGNEKAVQGAKDTILYAIIGLVVAILSIAIVNFVISGFFQ